MQTKFEGAGFIAATITIILGISLLFGGGANENTKEKPGKCDSEKGWVQCRAKVLDSEESGLTNRVTLMTQSGEYITVFSRRRFAPTSEFQNWNIKKEGEQVKELELSSNQPKEAKTVCARGSSSFSEHTLMYISPYSRAQIRASYAKDVKPLEYNQPGMAVIGPDGLVSETRPRTGFEENDCSSQDI